MKTLKKLLAIVVSVMMVLATMTTAFAVTVDNQTNHSYAAYQIFAGTQAEGETEGALAVSGWGSGIIINTDEKTQSTEENDFLTALKADDSFKVDGTNIFASCTTAADVAKVLSGYDDNTSVAEAFAALAYDYKTGSGTAIAAGETSVELDAGYYLIVDTTDTDGKDDYKNLALLQVTGKGNITIKDKSSKPTVKKKVYEESIDKYNDVADYDIGDDVRFQLTGTMPTDIASYDSYEYIFHDEMDPSLSFNEDSVVVKIDGKMVDSNDYDVVTTDLDDDCTFEVAFDNILSVKDTDGNDIEISANSTVVVDFTAELTSSAVIGLPGQINKVKLEYSNDVNEGGSGETGETPWDTVIVFTYELDITKTNEDGTEKLKGAEFQIIKDGKYAQFDPIYESTEEDNTEEDNTEEKVIIGWVVTGWTENADDTSTVLTTPEGGQLKIVGLDEGTYTLHEKTAPDGYVAAADKTLVITASTDEVQYYMETDGDGKAGPRSAGEILTSLTLTIDGSTVTQAENNAADGVVATDITNTKGGSLPETGGIGTTIFYVLGGVLVVVAGVLLITKKRMGSQN